MPSRDRNDRFRQRSALSGAFGSGRQSQPVTTATETRRQPRDEAMAPAGYDQAVWDLALLFRQRAHAHGVELRAGLPVIYSQIDELVTRHGIKGKTYRQAVTGCRKRLAHTRLAEHCWLHYPPLDPASQRDGSIGWACMVSVVILEFWSRVWDEHALDYFRQHFQETGQLVLDHWRGLRIAQDVARQPARRRGVMRRQEPGAIMADASKEG